MAIEILQIIIKRGGQLLNEYATLILVIITGWYAFQTHKIASIMRKQVVPDIRLSNIVLGSSFAESYFSVERIKEDSFCKFILLFDVQNRSGGSGSIDKPTLNLIFKNSRFRFTIPPIIKQRKLVHNSLHPNVQKSEIIDYGGTIYLRGGESLKIELKYCAYLKGEILKHIKDDFNSLEYQIDFSDNFGKSHFMRIDDVKGLAQLERSQF